MNEYLREALRLLARSVLTLVVAAIGLLVAVQLLQPVATALLASPAALVLLVVLWRRFGRRR